MPRGRPVKPEEMKRRCALGADALSYINAVVDELMDPNKGPSPERLLSVTKVASAQLRVLDKALPDLTKVEASEAAQEAVKAVVLDGEYQNLDERHKLVLATKLLRVVREAGDVESLDETGEKPSNDRPDR